MKRLLVAAALVAPALAVPIQQAGALPPARYTDYTYERVRVPMRDGVELSVDVWRPVTPAGTRVPVILTLTPYHVLYKALDPVETDPPAGLESGRFVTLGYAVAMADVRGTYGSGGCWDYGGIHERRDGYDLVEWLGTRPWSNGKVGMMGGSYDGTTANAAAVERPPHLATIVPISAISRWWGYAYQQGARATYSGEDDDIDPPGDTPTDFMFGYGFLPPPDPGALTAAQQTSMRWTPCARADQTLHGYDTEPDYDAFWIERDYLRLAGRVRVPVLVTHGLLDFNVKTWEGTAWFQALRVPKVLVIGQWPHASPGRYYTEWGDLLSDWFARWLYGVRNGVERGPAVRVQSSDRTWHDMSAWGAGRVHASPLGTGDYTFTDDGLLTESEILRNEYPLRYFGVHLLSARGIRIHGRPRLRLTVTSTMTSTHLVAVLADVGPTGTLTVVSRAFLNARYRGGLTTGVDLVPGTPYRATLEFIDKDWVVPADHHLAVFVGSASTTWVLPDEQRSTNTLHLSQSRLELPLVR